MINQQTSLPKKESFGFYFIYHFIILTILTVVCSFVNFILVGIMCDIFYPFAIYIGDLISDLITKRCFQ